MRDLAILAAFLSTCGHGGGSGGDGGGACVPAALTATGATSAEEQGFAVDEASMYWVDARATAVPGVYRAAKAGGAAARIGDAAAGSFAYSIAVDDEAVYVAATADGVTRMGKADGAWTTLYASACAHPRELAVDGGELFVLENDDAGCGGPRQAIVALPAAGGAVRLVAAAAYMGRLRLDGDYAYFLDAVNATVSRVPKAGGATEPVATTGLTQPTLLTVDGGVVFVGDTKTGQIVRAPSTVIWTHPADSDVSLHAIVAGGGRVWVGWDDRLGVVNADGSGFTQLGARLGVQFGGLALDDERLYAASGDLYRICR